MTEDYADYATRAVNEEEPVEAWACCWADKSALSEQKPGQPLKAISGYLPPQVIPWDDSSLAVGIFKLWGSYVSASRNRDPRNTILWSGNLTIKLSSATQIGCGSLTRSLSIHSGTPWTQSKRSADRRLCGLRSFLRFTLPNARSGPTF